VPARTLPDSLRDTLRATLDAAVTRGRGPRSTIEPPRSSDAPALDGALALLGRLGARPNEIAIDRTLGEGGMGVVRLGRQLALDREVAVKAVKPAARSRASTLKLLREAWVTGALEHPNVVPVYDVRLDAAGEPQIVLKKIEGSPWSDLLADAHAVAERFHAPDLLEWNLRVLMQVASAVHYAHERGIVHRDLKPDNVMIGRFGEVYVVDWGLALALRDDGTGRLPLACEAKDFAGTPCYMAPEMLGGDDACITERTDVYLLGAVLYEIACGAPPRDGGDVYAIVAQVWDAPTVPDHVPEELARIVRRAMDPDPDARFENAEQVRLALAGFLAHRGSIQLSERAAERAKELETAEGAPGEDADDQRLRVYHLFGECRFGFQQALRAWPDNAHARDGLRGVTERMAEFELRHGDPRAAQVLLSGVDAPDSALLARVDAARRARDEEDAHKTSLARDADPSIGRRTRVFVTLVMSAIWTFGPLAAWWASLRWPHRDAYPAAVVFTLLLMAIGNGFGYWARDSLSRTAINRNLVTTVRVTIAGQLALFLGAWALGVPYPKAHVLMFVVWGLGVALGANAVDRRLWPAAAAYVAAFGAAIVRPDLRYPATAAANFVLFLMAMRVWANVREDVDVFLRRRAEIMRRRGW
jgi:serine/threonine-protein kinase